MKKALIVIFITLFCSTFVFSRSLEEIKKSGVIYGAFTESALNSVNYKIALEFAKFLNVRLVVVKISWDETFSRNGAIPADYITNSELSYTPDALKKADFICGTIYVYDWREKFFDFAGIMLVSDLLIVPKKSDTKSEWFKMLIPQDLSFPQQKKNIKNYNDLKGKSITFLQNSSYQNNIKLINEKIGGGINFLPTSSEDESQQLLMNGDADGLITVSYLALEFIKSNPNYILAFPLSKPQKVGWAVENDNSELSDEIENFFETIKGNGKLNGLFKEQYGGVDYSTYLQIIHSYAESNSSDRDLDEIIASEKLIVALREREMVYSDKGKKQFSHYLAEEFAKYLGVDLEIQIIPDFETFFKSHEGQFVKDSAYLPERFKRIDIACDLFEPADWCLNKIDVISFVPNAQVVVGRKNLQINSLHDLQKLKGVVAKNSDYEQALIENSISNFITTSENPFDLLVKNKADYTVVSYSVYSLPNYPLLEAKFILGEINKTGWGIKKNQPKLRQKILEFIQYAKYVGIMDESFKIQTNMPFKAAENYLNALHQTYQTGVFPFVFYGTNDGLPQEDILSIFQDREGYLWLGNYSGIVKFNGRSMRVYNEDDGLASNVVFDIKQDSTGILYIATLRGISMFGRNKFKTFLPGISFKNIFIDYLNNKWCYGNNGLFLITGKNDQIQLNKKYPALPLNINSVTQDNKGNHSFIATSNGLYLLDLKNENLSKLSGDYCYSIFIDESEKIWLSTEKGVFYGDITNFASGNFGESVNSKINIENTVINKIDQSKDGAIWLISDYKVYQIFTLEQKPIVFDNTIGLNNQRILSFMVDNEENIWFGYSGGLQKLTTKSLRIFYPDFIKNYVGSIIEDMTGGMWIGLSNEMYYFKDKLINLNEKYQIKNKSSVIQNYKNSILIASPDEFLLIDPINLSVKERIRLDENILHLDKMYVSSRNEIFLLTGLEGTVYYTTDIKNKLQKIENVSTSLMYQLVEYQGKIIGGNNTGLVVFNGKTFENFYKLEHTVWSLCVLDSALYVGTENGLGVYKDTEFNYLNLKLANKSINAILPAKNNDYLWIGTNQGFSYLNLATRKIEFSIDAKDGLPGNEVIINGLLIDQKGLLWINTFHGISTFDLKKMKNEKFTPECRIERILLNGDEIATLRTKLKYWENNLVFELTGLSFKDEKSLEYEFFLKGLDNDFGASKGKEHRANYPNLPPGKYDFVYRTKGKDGIWSYYKHLSFEIQKPFWLEWWFYIAVAALAIALGWLFIKARERTLRKRNEHLEKIVRERTAEIAEQKNAIEQKNVELEQQQEEILAQRDELEIQRDIAMKQRDEIGRQQKDIMDSIFYAKRIQNALLPPKRMVSDIFPEHFILFKPRDIVSGDFYWLKAFGNKVIVAAADCTGHGVPGAFMSMLGSAFLNEITIRNQNLTAGEMLNQLRYLVVGSLHQTGKIDEAKDGMDIALCVLNTDDLSIQFAGAFNPLYFMHNNEIIEYKADRMPIGIHDNLDQAFTNHNIQAQKGDSIYIFSDGFASQFGGADGKKFMSARFKSLLQSNNDKEMTQQKMILDQTIEEWMGERYSQVDDILVIGIKI